MRMGTAYPMFMPTAARPSPVRRPTPPATAARKRTLTKSGARTSTGRGRSGSWWPTREPRRPQPWCGPDIEITSVSSRPGGLKVAVEGRRQMPGAAGFVALLGLIFLFHTLAYVLDIWLPLS